MPAASTFEAERKTDEKNEEANPLSATTRESPGAALLSVGTPRPDKPQRQPKRAATARSANSAMAKLKGAGTHSSLRSPTAAQIQKARLSNTCLDESLQSEEVIRMRAALGQEHLPSVQTLMHLAKCKAERNQMVVPEFTERIPETDEDGVAFPVTGKENSLGMELHAHVFNDVDMPLKLMLVERNAVARREIAKTILLDPDCLFRQVWDGVQLLLLVWLALHLPYRVGFSLPDPELWSAQFWWNVGVDVYFVVDIYLSFITCHYDEDGVLVVDRRQLFAAYFQGWFFLDLLSVMPLPYLPYVCLATQICEDAPLLMVSAATVNDTLSMPVLAKDDETSSRAALKLLKLFRLVKLLRLVRLKRLMQKYEAQFYVLFQRLKTFNLIIVIGVVAHWVACVWNFVGTVEGEDGNPYGWVVDAVASRYADLDGTVPLLDDVPKDELYLVNYYTAIGTLITGYVPMTTERGTMAEFFFSVFAIVAGGFVYGNVVGAITELNRKANLESDIGDHVTAQARAMCRIAGADAFLTRKILAQVNFSRQNAPDPDTVGKFLDSLPGELEMAYAQQLGWVPKVSQGMPQWGLLHKVPFLSVLDNRSKMMICSKLRYSQYEPYNINSVLARESGAGRRITIEGNPSNDMYIVMEGKVAVVQSHQEIGILTEHCYFGENNILQPQRVSSYGQAVIAHLGYEDFQQLRRSRREINDAVLPYIRELAGRRTSQRNWFYVEMYGAEGLDAFDCDTLGEKGKADPYCCMFWNDRLIGKTDVDQYAKFIHLSAWLSVSCRRLVPYKIALPECSRMNLNPTWRKCIGLTRDEVEKALARGKDEVRFEIYDFDQFSDPDLMGQVTTTMTALCKKQHFREWTNKDDRVESLFPLMQNSDEDGTLSPTAGTLNIRLCNEDSGVHFQQRLKSGASMADTKRRQDAAMRRHIHVTDTDASIAELKEQVNEIEAKLDQVLVAIGSKVDQGAKT